MKDSLYEHKVVFILCFISIAIYLTPIVPGLFSTDENANLFLSRSIAEHSSLKLDSYFPGQSIYAPLALPLAFSIKENHVYADVDPGYPLMSSPFYKFFGLKGLQIFNGVITSITLILLYFGGLKIWGSREAGIFSALLYLFGTYSLFYSASLWHQTLMTMGFIGAQISWVYLDKGSNIQLLFLLTSLIAISSAFYMLVPISILLVYVLKKKLWNGSVFLVFLITILAIFWYNAHTSFSIMGTHNRSLITSFSTVINNFVRMMFYRGYEIDPLGYYWRVQKSILESSPFLITSFVGLFYLKRKELIVPNLAYFIMISLYTPPDYGGPNINMRYLLPILPFMTLLSAGFITRFYEDYRSLILLLLISTISSYFLSPIIVSGGLVYLKLKILSLCLVIGLFTSSIVHIRMKSRGTHYLLILLFVGSLIFSNFFSVYDLKMGNLIRSHQKLSHETLMGFTSAGDIVIVPNFTPWDRTVIEDRIMFYYPTPFSISGYNKRGMMLQDLIEQSIFLNKRVNLVFWIGDDEIERVALKFSNTVVSLDDKFSMIILENQQSDRPL